MTENLRETFRVEPGHELDAELFHEGRVAPCQLENLSAGGARVRSALQMPSGAQCTLGVRLGEAMRSSSTPAYVSFLMEVLETIPDEDASTFDYRLRSTTAPGSSEYETAAKLVFAAQRSALAAKSGSTRPSSPMASDGERRRRFWMPRAPRFGKRAMRPDAD
jgi:hypothetical protein